ncbi:unnamed protein product [Allacma fusca]|uniref:Photolyase/cryptochrome alpha/beta domain-containing protein n=1 Tax=Allacma fusca TaxID=39272 RepID=A0A8J2KVG9_9HEXA|nr:unnamed protein product [Allacma fusca]
MRKINPQGRAQMSQKQATVIHWFRKGLRLHDNPALIAAVEKLDTLPSAHLRPIFILDTKLVETYRVGANRWRFLVDSLADLDKSLRSLGTRLYVLRGDPVSQFKFALKNWNVKLITYETDTEPYARKRDVEVFKLAEEAGVEVKYFFSHTLYEPIVLLRQNKSEAPKTYQKFLDVVSKAGEPPASKVAVTEVYKQSPPKDPDKDKYQLPTLRELHVDESKLGPHLYPGGETEALRRLTQVMTRKTYISNFEKPNTSPNSIEPSTTVLSPDPNLLICKQIDWDVNPEYLSAWAEGRTGYPFIDAIMTQLRKEGWIHHLARHAVACFLTRGDLWISWEEGQLVFEELLLDADVYLNAGNWMWLSASAFFHQYYRVYSPIVFGKKTDPHGEYIRKYLPKLAKYPPNYIYEPWTAPMSVQKAAGCIIGTDYPKPIVDHAKIHKVNLQRMNAAYKKVPSPPKKNTPKFTRASREDDDDSSVPFAKKFRSEFC